jgi:aryl-alcohol dehydrogenase-like predicted oxidoreductase
MQTRKLGDSNLEVSAIGLGCMGMSFGYGPPMDRQEAVSLIRTAVERGVTFFDTAEVYGPFTNEELVGKAIAGRPRDEVTIATKWGIRFAPTDDNPTNRVLDGSRENVRNSIEGSLKRLGVDHVDLYYLHRVDPGTPIEETVGAMGELVAAGKVRHIGLSEASAETLRRASKIHPITALQSEYSLWTRDPEDDGVLAACRELGIGFVAYSPLGRGFLTGRFHTLEDLPADDYRRHSPRFQGDNFAKNLELVREIERLAREKNVTASQLALAWVLARGDDIVPIPGTKKRAYLEENMAAAAIRLTSDELARIDAIAPSGVAAGGRYPASVHFAR